MCRFIPTVDAELQLWKLLAANRCQIWTTSEPLVLAGDWSRYVKEHSVKEKEEEKAKLNQIEDYREKPNIWQKYNIMYFMALPDP